LNQQDKLRAMKAKLDEFDVADDQGAGNPIRSRRADVDRWRRGRHGQDCQQQLFVDLKTELKEYGMSSCNISQ
jgi:hypothetical protein